MKMKFATISRRSNKIIDMFDGEVDAYHAITQYEAADRANNKNSFNNYFVSMMILDSDDNVVIQGRKN